MEDKSTEKQKNKIIKYTLGCIALSAVSIVIIPQIIKYCTPYVYNMTNSTKVSGDENWGPKLVKKTNK